MYPEFVPIYIGLLAIGVIVMILLVLVIILLVRTGRNGGNAKRTGKGSMYSTVGGGVVFCKNCATKFDSAQPCCPKCGTYR